MANINDQKIYLDRLAKPLAEKLRITRFLPATAKKVLDVGCADGTVTLALADLFPQTQFLGLDLNTNFIGEAKKRIGERKNIQFESGYLRERLNRPEKFDAVIFCSVLHEFYSYGEGISTVVKALSDAREILVSGGGILIRDMLLYEYMSHSNLLLGEMTEKIYAKAEWQKQVQDFEGYFGKINTLALLNHFLLKYWYVENWDREGKENYTPVSFEKYDQILSLLDLKILFRHSYLIPYLKDKWGTDFNFSEDEMAPLRSTGIVVVQKI